MVKSSSNLHYPLPSTNLQEVCGCVLTHAKHFQVINLILLHKTHFVVKDDDVALHWAGLISAQA